MQTIAHISIFVEPHGQVRINSILSSSLSTYYVLSPGGSDSIGQDLCLVRAHTQFNCGQFWEPVEGEAVWSLYTPSSHSLSLPCPQAELLQSHEALSLHLIHCV